MTEARRIAREHINYRRGEGWTWGRIIAEIRDCADVSAIQIRGRMDTKRSLVGALALVCVEVAAEARRPIRGVSNG